MAKAPWKHLPPKLRREFLRSAEAVKAIPAQSRRDALQAIERLYRQVAPTVCTQAWLEAWELEWAAYPPTPDDPANAMRTARRTRCWAGEDRVLWPAYYVSGAGATADWRAWNLEQREARLNSGPDESPLHQTTTSSPSGAAIMSLGNMRVDGAAVTLQEQVPMLVDDEAALVAEIEHYQETGEIAEPLTEDEHARLEASRRRNRVRSRMRTARYLDPVF